MVLTVCSGVVKGCPPNTSNVRLSNKAVKQKSEEMFKKRGIILTPAHYKSHEKALRTKWMPYIIKVLLFQQYLMCGDVCFVNNLS